jgi:hypothetical protein
MIVVETNDPLRPTVTLNLRAEAIPVFSISEPFIYFAPQSDNIPISRELLVTLASGMHPTTVQTTDPSVSAQIVAAKGMNESQFKLIVIKQPCPIKGYFYGKVIIKTSGSPVSEIEIPFRGVS